MRKVILKTSTGDLVTEQSIPAFNEPAQVLIWGQRIFKFDKEDGNVDHYTEAFAYWIPPAMES